MRQHFAQFDDELQDSDQTISTPARHGKPRARLPTVTSTSNNSSEGLFMPARRRFQSSAFFSDSTDDDFSRPLGRNQLSMSACSRRGVTQMRRSLLHMSAGPGERRRRSDGPRESVQAPRLHVDAIQFPVTRSVLWDRRRLSAASIGVSLGQVLPNFIMAAEALKEIHKLYGEKSAARANGAPLCYLYGDVTPPRAKKVFLEGVKLKREEALAAGAWCIPVHPVQDGSNPGLSQESYAATIAAVQSSYRDEYGDNVASKLQPKLLVFRSSPHASQLDFQLECAASPVLLKFSLVRNLPLLMTPLAASLARREFNTQSSNMRTGYLTLDRTRKAVPLLKVDSLVLQQPLVGVWVYGVRIDDAWDEETARRQLADPFLYFACLGYLMSRAIKERVGPEKNTFLVALYPDDSGGVVSLPRFFECSFPAYLSPPARPLPMELYSHRRSCLVGVPKFSTDVELTLSASPTTEWEAARRQAEIPTAPRSEETQDLDSGGTQAFIGNDAQERSLTSQDIPSDVEVQEQSGNITSGWTITADTIRKSAPAYPIAHSHASEEDACNVPTSAEVTAPEVEEKPATPPSDDDASEVIRTHAARESPRTSPPNELEDVAEPREWRGNNSGSYRSCCKTQQLLTIQHQQILENQQRQLQEMQGQITQLRRLLKTARSHNQNEAYPSPNDHDYDSDASSSSIGAVADVSTTLSRHGNGYRSSQSSMVSAPRQSGDAPFSDKSSVHSWQENEKEEIGNEGKSDSDASISSLGLSSISNGSDADLSSLSSSLVDERLKRLGEKQAGTKQNGDEGLNQSHLSAGAEKQDVEVQTNMNTQAELPSEAGDQVRDDIEIETSARDLSFGELRASLNEKATRDTAKADVAFVDHDEDFAATGNNCSMVEHLLSPDAYLRKVGGFVDHHGGCFTTPPLDFHSFCVPRIKFSIEGPECSPSDSEDEEVRLIEQKYMRLMAA
ncbi:hypothetical protein KRP22_005683 [Phytophthora ramorum]|nr:SCL-interrupting locus protein-like protein [Phytophthora ramorum]